MGKIELIDTWQTDGETGQAKHGKMCRVSGKNDPEVRGCGSGGD